jgi:hypothetical protein
VGDEPRPDQRQHAVDEGDRAAVTDFKVRYNRHWRLEKPGFISPHEARQAHAMRKAA